MGGPGGAGRRNRPGLTGMMSLTRWQQGFSRSIFAAALVGMWLGQMVRGKVRAETFRLCFFIGLLLLGAHLALRGLL